MIKIALIGDRSDEVIAHSAIPLALQLVADKHQFDHSVDWIHSTEIVPNTLSCYHGIWCVPGSPYQEPEKVIEAIRFARENDIAFLGTCGGYQHAVIEYARNVLGHSEASSIEDMPGTSMPLINAMFCSMREKPGKIELKEASQLHSIYQQRLVEEQYNCGFGVNADYLSIFENTGFNFTGFSTDTESLDDPRAFELAGHSFFIGTAYQPERAALRQKIHPLIERFLTGKTEHRSA